MISHKINFTPSLYIQNEGEESTKIALALTKAKTKFVVRFTGGCGYMSENDGCGLYDIFTRAFVGFEGAMLFGGTRMIKKEDKATIVPGITEIPPLIKKESKNAVILGVIPKTSDLSISLEYGLTINSEKKKDYITVIHPDQDMCLVVQGSVDGVSCWEAEFEECIRITANLRDFASWNSLLISYNGGSVTEKEILKTAKLGWPVLLVKGSGRISDEYANNKEFVMRNPNVKVVEKNSRSIRMHLYDLGALSREPLRLAKKDVVNIN